MKQKVSIGNVMVAKENICQRNIKNTDYAKNI